MTWFTYEDEHRDFEDIDSNSEQKLKGPVSFTVGDNEPPKVDLQVEIKKRTSILYKIKEKVTNARGNTRKLF